MLENNLIQIPPISYFPGWVGGLGEGKFENDKNNVLIMIKNIFFIMIKNIYDHDQKKLINKFILIISIFWKLIWVHIYYSYRC